MIDSKLDFIHNKWLNPPDEHKQTMLKCSWCGEEKIPVRGECYDFGRYGPRVCVDCVDECHVIAEVVSCAEVRGDMEMERRKFDF